MKVFRYETTQKYRKRLLLVAWALSLSLFIAPAAFAQKTISGVVSSVEDKLSLPGASVVEKGTTNGTLCDLSGRYELKVKGEQSVLLFSMIGFESQEITVGQNSTIEVSLKSASIGIEGVVVVGYGTQKKASLTGAVASANMTQIDKIPGGDITKMLAGQVAGVNVSVASGAPGATPQILIRGLSSTTSSDPLVIIDGIPGDITFVNPADIESINVLKDASAATIYGSRASNGVLLITTKRGKKGEPKASLKTYLGIHNPMMGDVKMANRDQYNLIHTQALENSGEALYPWITDLTLPDSKWGEAFMKQGIESKVDFSVMGGGDYASYGFTMGYYKNTGTVINTDNTNITARLNTDFKLLKDHLLISPSLSIFRMNRGKMYEPTGSGNGGWSDFMEVAMQIPHKNIYDDNETYGFAVPPDGFPSGNPIALRSIVTDKNQTDYIQAGVNAEVVITKALSYKFFYGANVKDYYNYYHMPAYNYGNQSQLENTFLSEERGRTNHWVMNNLLTYTKAFDLHKIDLLAGFSREKAEFRYTGGSNREIPSDDLTTLSSGIGDRDAWGDRSINTLQSVFGRANYEFAEKYLMQGSIRYDGSSKFSEKNKYGLFYSFSAGWAMHKEDFFEVSWISELKPRFSYGTLGNQNIGDFQYLDLISTGGRTLNYPLGYPNITQPINIGATTINSAAYNIKWEESAITNFGFDIGLFKSHLTLNFDYFYTNTKDMLVVIPRPYSSGFNSFPRTNGGSMINKGWELTTTYRNSKDEFNYSVSVNLAHSKNELTKLGSAGEYYIDGYVDYENNPTTKTEVGGEIGRFYMFHSLGIFQNEEEITAHKAQPDAVPGDLIFEDINLDGEITDEDKTYVGSAMPDFAYGVNLNLAYKKFDLSMFFEGSHGNKMYNGFRMMMFRSSYQNNTLSELVDAWTPENKSTEVFRNSSVDANYNLRVSDYFLEDASYLRLKNIQIGYNISEELLKKYMIKGIRIYAGSVNLFTITKYKGFDPALVNVGAFARGVDRGFYPLTKSFYFGLNFDF
jgi:TonB-linked SusC/RagA family outer membrane protein